jgi:hypothetical protein
MTQLTTPTFTMNLSHGLAVFWLHIIVMERNGERWDYDLVKDHHGLVKDHRDLVKDHRDLVKDWYDLDGRNSALCRSVR